MHAHRATFYKTLITLAILALAIMAASPIHSPLDSRLAGHVGKVATADHNPGKPEALEDAARYIETTLAALGYTVTRQEYTHDGHQVRNLEVSLANPVRNKAPERIFIVGAHYDSARGSPGANDNGSGTAAVLELARMLKGIRLAQGTELKFVFFVDEEPPTFGGDRTGRWQHARDLRARGSPRYPPALEQRYPDTGNFIAFVGTQASAELVRKALATFRATTMFPAEGLAAASYVEGVTWSDHTSYNRHGYPAIMITDTAFLRYPYYHTAQDTPDKLDYANMARVVEGLAKVIEGLAAPRRM